MIYKLYAHTGCDLQNVDFLPGSFDLDPIRDPGAESNDRGVEVGGSITHSQLNSGQVLGWFRSPGGTGYWGQCR